MVAEYNMPSNEWNLPSGFYAPEEFSLPTNTLNDATIPPPAAAPNNISDSNGHPGVPPATASPDYPGNNPATTA
jgi:hypothetical protein